MVSNVRHLTVARRTVPAAFGSEPPVPISLADSRPHATAASTSTLANRSVISVANSSRYSPSRSSTSATAPCIASKVTCQRSA